MRRSLILALAWIPLLLAASSPVRGQEEHIETDRDSFTRSPRIVDLQRTIVEGSYTFLEQDAEFDGHLFPDLLVRYGATDLLELRVGWTYEIGKFHHLAEEEAERSEEGLLTYGAKVYVTSAEQWGVDSSLIISGFTPTSGESNDTDLSIEYAIGRKWGEGWELDAGLRYFALAEEEDRFAEWAPSVVLKFPLGGPRWNGHVEYFSLLSVDREDNYGQHYIGPGTHFLVTDNLEIGVRVFWGMSDDSAEFVCNAGGGVRF